MRRRAAGYRRRVLRRGLDHTYAETVRHHVTALTVARLAANACYRFAPPFLATISRGVGTSLERIGIAIAISELLGLLSPLVARVIDRLPRRTAMAAGLAGVAVGTTVAASSPNLVVFGVGLVLLSQSKVVFDLGMGAWIADHVPYAQRGRVVGLTETSWAFGLLVGVSLMGVATGLANWRAGYGVGVAAVVAMAGIIAHRLPREPAPREVHHVAPGTSRRITSTGWTVIAGAMALMAASQCLFVTFGSWLEDDFDFRPAAIAAVVFGLGLGELLSSLTSARRTDVWGKERSAAFGAALMLPTGLALLAWHGHLSVGLAVLAVSIAGFEFAIVSTLAIGATLVPGAPARGLGMLVGAGTLGRALASVPATRLYERSGIGWPAAMSAVLGGVSATCFVAAGRARAAQPR